MIGHEFDILFDGVSLFEVLPDVKILDIEIGAVGIETITQARARRSGSDFCYNRNENRQITIFVELPIAGVATQEAYRNLRRWASSAEPKSLRLPQYPYDEIFAVLTSIGSYDEKKWYEPVELIFTAYDPCFLRLAWYGAKAGASFLIGGDDIPLARVECELSTLTQDPEFIFDDGKKIRLIGEYSGTIEIDLDRFNVVHNGMSVMNKLDIASRFPRLEPGRHRFTSPENATIKWKERWL